MTNVTLTHHSAPSATPTNEPAASTIHPTAVVYPNVQLGAGSVVGPFVILGEPPRGKAAGEVPTVIGPGAVLRSHTVIYAGNVIGAGFQTGHGALLRESNTIGDRVSVGSHSIIEHHVTLEDGVRIHSQAFIPEFSTLKRGSWVGPGVRFTNAPHPLCPDVKDCLIGPTLAPGAKIGANATLLPGVQIGENALVGAGAVVTHHVAPGDVVVGNPARVVKHIRDLVCPATGLDPYRAILGINAREEAASLTPSPLVGGGNRTSQNESPLSHWRKAPSPTGGKPLSHWRKAPSPSGRGLG